MRRFLPLLAGILLVGSCDDDTPVISPPENTPPSVTVVAPADQRPEPSHISLVSSMTIVVDDPDNEPLEVRRTFVDIVDFGSDWTVAEESLLTDPEAFDWSAWVVYTGGDTGMTVSDTLAAGFHVLAAQARDAKGAQSELNAGCVRRVVAADCAGPNAAPTMYIAVPRAIGLNPALVPPATTFYFDASDTDSAPEELSIRWGLVDVTEFNDSYADAIDFVLDTPEMVEWTPWQPYAPDGGSMVVAPPPLDLGPYVLAAQTRDPCGGVSVLDELASIRRLRVAYRSTGPLLLVRSRFLPSITTSVCDTPPVLADVFGGVEIEFVFRASADAYGGIVTGYRYGWDIVDPSDDSQWEIDYTPLVGVEASATPRTFYFGTHTFHVEVLDNSGYCTRAEYALNFVPYRPTRPLLLVDDYAADEGPHAGWDNPTGNGILPSDEEHDAFWLDMLSELSSFDPLTDVIEVDNTSNLPVPFLAQYEAVLWSVYSDVNQPSPTSLLYRLAAYRRAGLNPVPGYREVRLDDFIAAGGKILITGRHPMSNTINREFAYIPRFPFMQLYDHEGRQDVLPDVENPPGLLSTGYATLCDDVLDYAIATNIRTNSYRCPVQGLRNTSSTRLRDSGMREAVPIDLRFPRLRMHAQTAARESTTTRRYAGTKRRSTIRSTSSTPAFLRRGRATVFSRSTGSTVSTRRSRPTARPLLTG